MYQFMQMIQIAIPSIYTSAGISRYAKVISDSLLY